MAASRLLCREGCAYGKISVLLGSEACCCANDFVQHDNVVDGKGELNIPCRYRDNVKLDCVGCAHRVVGRFVRLAAVVDKLVVVRIAN